MPPKTSYGLPAFNVNNLEQMRAIMEAADQVNAPVIVQASAGARKYAGAPFLRHLILAAVEEFPHIPVVMHQDHGASPDVCQRSIQLGFSSVMMDGSLLEDGKTPSTYESTSTPPVPSLTSPTPAVCPSKAKSAYWATSKPAKPAKKTASAQWANFPTTKC